MARKAKVRCDSEKNGQSGAAFELSMALAAPRCLNVVDEFESLVWCQVPQWGSKVRRMHGRAHQSTVTVSLSLSLSLIYPLY